nr:hypothetical protein [Tanacetum cinerariifolium]
WDRPTLFNDNEEHSVQYKEYLENSSNEIVASNSNQEKEKPPQDSNIRQLVREECCIEISSIHAITPVLPTEEPEYSLSMGYEHLSTISKAESDEVIKSSAKNLLPILSEYEVTSDDESECDVPVKDKSSLIFTTFSNLIFDCNDDFTSSDDESLSDEDVSMEDFKDGDSQKEEIDIFTGTNDLLPPGIESDDYDLEGDIHFLEELLVDDSISILENESSDFDHHDDPSFPRPPPEPPDVEFFFNLKPDSGE